MHVYYNVEKWVGLLNMRAHASSSSFFVSMASCNSAPRGKNERKSYTREFGVVKFYKENNLYHTHKTYSLNPKTILRWVRDEKNIEKSRKACIIGKQHTLILRNSSTENLKISERKVIAS